MFYKMQLAVDAYHKPTQKWHTFRTTHGLRAVSRKHALSKALKVVMRYPVYDDRVNHPDWDVTAEAKVLDTE